MLRGLAIALVFTFHADAFLGMPFRNRVGTYPWLPLALVCAGHTGVTLFFVLSAFLLSLPFLAEAYGGKPVSRREFYVRRALRILPLFYTVVLVATVLTSRTAFDLLRAIPVLAFLGTKPGLTSPMPPWDGVWWSLDTEVQFYAILPVVALAFGRSGRVTLGILAVYALVWMSVVLGVMAPTLNPAFRSLSIIGRGPLFVLGMLAAWVYYRHGHALRARLAACWWLAAGGADLALFLVLAALAAFLRWKLQRGSAIGSPRELIGLVPDGLLWSAVVIMVLILPLRAKALYLNRFLRWLGVISYSIYLVHLPLIRVSLGVMRTWVPQMGVWWSPMASTWFVCVTLACLGYSSLTYRFIEVPFLRRKARVASTGSPAAARAA